MVSSTLDLRKLYETIYQQIGRVMDVTHFLIALKVPGSSALELPYHRQDGALFVNQKVPQGRSVTALVLERGLTLLFHTHAEYERYAQQSGVHQITLGPHQSKAKVWVPLNSGHRTIGVLTVQSPHDHAYRQDDVETLSIIAAQAAIAIENARLFGEQQTRVDELQKMEKALRESESSYRSLVELAPDMIYSLSAIDGTFTMLSPAFETITGETAEKWIGRSFLELIHPDDVQLASERFRQTLRNEIPPPYELRIRSRSGDYLVGEFRSIPKRENGRVVEKIGIARDISDRKRMEEVLRESQERYRDLALHDGLTNLPNRTLLYDRVDQALRRAHRDSSSVALLLMDLDRFKEINDTFGHHYGDLLLQQVAERLDNLVRESDTVARLGGDEFAVLLPNATESEAVAATNRVLGIFSRPVDLEGHAFDVDASIGIAMYPQHGADVPALLKRADVAMYAAKRARRGFALYNASQEQQNPARLLLVGELRHAIEHGELVLHFQPGIHLSTGRVEYVEALLRWQHPTHGLVAPEHFIPLAEETGLIRALTQWVLGQATRQCALWQAAQHDFQVSVNLAAGSLLDQPLLDSIDDLISVSDVSPGWLRLEITEGAMMTCFDHAAQSFTRLHDLGLTMCIDNFGSGYSSVEHLRQLPINVVKLDRSLLAGIRGDEAVRRNAAAAIDLCHHLGSQGVAEGIEDGETSALLAAMGCEVGQGFYLGRPMTAAKISELLVERVSVERVG
ncbi:MAG: putative bifunctional diguanylate cyclase/phosphodiesterase [Chloroflexota bacterium]